MKKLPIFLSLIFAFLAMAFATDLSAQTTPKDSLPPYRPIRPIQDSLKHRFPGAINITWAQQGNNSVATFYRNSRQVVATYNSNAQWQRTEIAWKIDSILPGVKTSLAQNYPGYTAQSVSRVFTRGKGPSSLVVLEKSGTIRKVEFDDKGIVIKSE